jgi:hypothetical protein
MTFRPYARKVRLGDTETFLDISNLPDGYVLSRKGSEIVAELIGQSKLGLESPVNAGDAATKGYVDTEINSAESALQSNLNSETSSRIAGDAAETSARAAAITSEASSRVAGDAAEASARAAADTALGTRIDNLLTNTDETALNSLAEIVSAFQSADGYLTEMLTSLSTGNSSALVAETSARVAADGVLQGNIDAEASTRAAADSTLETSVDDEISARIAGDAAEASARAAAVSAEESARIAGDLALTTSLGNETSARIAGDDALRAYADDYFLGGSGSHTLLVQDGGQFATVQDAIDAAVDGDVILVGPKAAGWGSISITSAKKLTIASYAQSATGQKLCRVSSVDINIASGADPNLCEINIAGLFIGGSVADGAALVRFTGAGSARLRMRQCGIFKSGAGDAVESSNSGAGSSFYVEDCFINTQGVDGVTLKHVSGFTQVQGRSTLVNGAVVASCSAGDLVIVGSQLSAGATSAGPVLQASGGTLTVGNSSVSFPKASGVGASVSSGAILGVDQVSFLIGTGAALATGKAITGAGTLVLGEATFGPALVYSSTVDAATTPAVKAGGALNSALSMSPNGGTTRLKITDLADCVNPYDAANKAYVDGEIDSTESAFQVSLNSEISSRIAGDASEASTRAAAVSAEESARIAGDSDLQDQINDILSNTDPGSLDSLTEIVSAFQNADGYLTSLLSDLSTGNSSALGLETSARIAADLVLQGNVDSEVSARIAGDLALTNSLGDETSARVAADASEASARAAAVSTEESARIAGDLALTNSLGDETSARVAADLVLQGNVDSEVSARIAGDAALTNSLGDETSARIAADTTLTNNLNSEISARIAGDIASRLLAVRTVTASDTITASDDLILINGTGSTVVTLPTAVGNSGKKIIVKKIDNAVGGAEDADTVAAASGEQIDGGSSVNIFLQYEAITFVSNGTKWLIV